MGEIAKDCKMPFNGLQFHVYAAVNWHKQWIGVKHEYLLQHANIALQNLAGGTCIVFSSFASASIWRKSWISVWRSSDRTKLETDSIDKAEPKEGYGYLVLQNRQTHLKKKCSQFQQILVARLVRHSACGQVTSFVPKCCRIQTKEIIWVWVKIWGLWDHKC